MTIANNFTRRTALAGIAVAAALTALPAAGHAEDTIRVLRSPVGTFQGLYIAEEQGYFKDAGLKVEISVGGAPTQNIAQLQAGQTDIIMTGSFDLVTAVAQGLPVVAVLNTQDQGDVGTTGLVVPKGSAIKTVADLKGKNVALPGAQSTQGLMVARALRTAGMKLSDINIVNLPPDAMIESATRGTVDAITVFGLFFPLAKSQGFTELPEVYNEIKGTPAVIFASTKQWASEHADALKRFNDAMLKAYDYANAHPEAVRAVDTAQTKQPADFIATRYIAPFVGKFQRDKWAAAVADMKEFGYIPNVPAEADFIWEGAPK
jgi:ABC-type nitrate/sulfonate/bicarbonate transport system substrate-binding protein